jgi:rhodanese-related sulfurtransferase
MRILLPAVTTLALFAACHSASVSKEAELPALTVDQVQALIASGQASVFDNNAKERFEQSHVPGAKWLSFKDVKASDLPEDKARTLVFYCANEH